MKKLTMVLVCLMTMVMSVNAQNWSMEAKQNAVKIIKCKLKAPSTFVLTDYYGNKIPVSKISAEYIREKVVVDSVMYGKDASVVDSIEYIYDKETGRAIDYLEYTSYKTIGIDSIEYYKLVYPPCYKCTFYYEAQNSFGGMVQGFAVVYVTKGMYVSKYLDYESRSSSKVKICVKNVFKPVNIPSVKVIKTYTKINRKKTAKLSNGKTYDVGAMLDYIDHLNSLYEEAE